MAVVTRVVPLYGEPWEDERDGVSGDDRKLPVELEHRVDRWARKNAWDRERLRSMESRFSSFNALVRAELRAGRL
jgi:hypothetical protein